MRFFEFKSTFFTHLREDTVSSPADDLSYLITNTDLSPEILKFLHDSLKNMIGKEDDVDPVSTNNDPQKVAAPNTIPSDEEPVDKLKESSASAMEAELMAALSQAKKQGTHEKQLSRLLYVLRDEAFKKLASDIVKQKFKSKNQESYELIKNKIRGLSTKVTVQLMTDFLNDCKEGGVIDVAQMITSEEKSPIPITDPKYTTIVKSFLDIELPRIGRGEIGLAFAGTNTVKGATDITVSGIDIEVKASRGKDFFMKGNADEGGFGNQNKAVEILANRIAKVGAQFKPNNRAGKGGIASIGKTNISNFNQYFVRLGRKETIKLLVDVLKELNKKSPDIVEQHIDDISSAVNKDGSVNYSALELATAKINFSYYKLMAEHEGVLVLDLKAFAYFFVSDVETWADYVKKGILVQMYALDFRSNGLGGIAYKL
jgi:hypothetical protein